MAQDNRNNLGEILKLRRVTIPLTLQELAVKAGMSASHLGRIERGERFPSARILRKIANPLGFSENELFVLADYLPPQPSEEVKRPTTGQLDPSVATLLSQEPVETQRTVVAILTILKSIAKGIGGNIGLAEYVHRNYPRVNEDVITVVEDLLEHPVKD